MNIYSLHKPQCLASVLYYIFADEMGILVNPPMHLPVYIVHIYHIKKKMQKNSHLFLVGHEILLRVRYTVYGVAASSRLLEIIGLFCKRDL